MMDPVDWDPALWWLDDVVMKLRGWLALEIEAVD